MIDRTPPNRPPVGEERSVDEIRRASGSSGAGWFLAALAVLVIIVGGLFLFGEQLGFGGSDDTVNMQETPMQETPPATTAPQSEPAPTPAPAPAPTAPSDGGTGETTPTTPSPTPPATE